MLQTINTIYEDQIVGGIFSNHENADQAIKAFEDIDISSQNIQVIQLHDHQTRDPYTNFLVGRGFSHSQALYYDNAIRMGEILVTLYEVIDLDLVMDIFNKYNAKYKLRNKRQHGFR